MGAYSFERGIVMKSLEIRVWDGEKKMMHTSPKSFELRCDKNGAIKAVNYDRQHKEQELKILQFTGVVDSNGVKIFEDDVVMSQLTGAKYLICWSDENAAWYKRTLNANTKDRPIYQDAESQRVIGNVHTNQELLEGE
jgi:meiotically up-regulated gene 157 (Mug157) protein